MGATLATFSTILLGIFIEAVPFLLLGALVSGLIEVFVDPSFLERILPRRPLAGAVAGAFLGLAFPVCECGVVPVVRRLYRKGLPLPTGIAFLLAAPVVNPVVLISTWTAFGWGPMLLGRFALTVAIAAVVGLIFVRARPDEVLLPAVDRLTEDLISPLAHAAAQYEPPPPIRERLGKALLLAGDDFLDMGRYLVAGAMLAAGMQTLVPQDLLLRLGQGQLSGILVLMTLAFVLSVCSTVDAFLALAFTGTFSAAAVLSFLVFGPMVDIKSMLMFAGVFRRRVVVYLVLLPLLLTLAATLLLGFNIPLSALGAF